MILTASLGDETLLFQLRGKIGKLIVKVYFGRSVKESFILFLKPHANQTLSTFPSNISYILMYSVTCFRGGLGSVRFTAGLSDVEGLS